MARAGRQERALRGRYWKALRQRRDEHSHSVAGAQSRCPREQAWRAEAEVRVAELASTQQIWRDLLELRTGEARDADVPSYIDLRWGQLGRVDYGPGDLRSLHYGIEEWVSPVLVRIHEEQRVTGGLKACRPWDFETVPTIIASPEPAPLTRDLLEAAGTRRELRSMIQYAEELSTRASEDPSSEDPSTVLTRFLMRWADSAMIDSFEAWAYEHPGAAMDSEACARQWQSCWLRFLPGVDWTGLDQELGTEWHDRWPIFLAPLRAIETAIAQLLAVQVWTRSRRDSKEIAALIGSAVAAPGLAGPLAVAGGRFALAESAVREAVEVLEDALA